MFFNEEKKTLGRSVKANINVTKGSIKLKSIYKKDEISGDFHDTKRAVDDVVDSINCPSSARQGIAQLKNFKSHVSDKAMTTYVNKKLKESEAKRKKIDKEYGLKSEEEMFEIEYESNILVESYFEEV